VRARFVWQREDGQRNMGANGARHPLIKDDGVVEFFIIQRESTRRATAVLPEKQKFFRLARGDEPDGNPLLESDGAKIFLIHSGILFKTVSPIQN
jgi:hypothetical protein